MPYPKSDGCILCKFTVSGGKKKKKKTKGKLLGDKLLMTCKYVHFGKTQTIIFSSVSMSHPGSKEH